MKILYFSCHQTLEYDELRLFQELGHEVFSIGHYLDPAAPISNIRPPLPQACSDSELLTRFKYMNPDYKPTGTFYIDRAFLKRFDVVITQFHFDELFRVWTSAKDVPLIVRSPGQPSQWYEHNTMICRLKGAKIIRFSPFESRIQGYCGEDAIIRLYVEPEVYKGWEGSTKEVLTFCNNLVKRKAECNLENYLKVVQKLPFKLFGVGNDGVQGWQGTLSNEDLVEAYKMFAAYFNLGTHPAPYTYGFIEAWCSGCPVVTWGEAIGGQRIGAQGSSFEIPSLVENGVDAICSDSPSELFYALKCLLLDRSFAKSLSEAGRAKCQKIFSKEAALEEWKKVFNVL